MSSRTTSSYDVIVIGGGAAGMYAAGVAASRGLRVVLLEKNKRLGAKLRITGGGRCNITNAEQHQRTLLSHYGAAEQFLYSAFSEHGVADVIAFFESQGLLLVEQAGKRMFPKSERAEDVARVLESYLREQGVVVRCDSPVSFLEVENGVIAAVQAAGSRYVAKEYILATGGVSHPETGSTGDGFAWLRKLGHTVIAPTPTIVPLAVPDQWVRDLAGASLEPMKMRFFVDGQKSFAIKGKILFTHFGLSGPLILNTAKKVADLLLNGVVTATIDAYPTTDLGALDKKLVAVFDAHKNKTLKNIIKEFSPEGLHKGLATVYEAAGIALEQKVHSVSKEDRKKMVRLLKALPLTIEGLMGFDRAVVADGGVPLTEIDPRSMRSTKIKNLYIIGDLLHINRPSGGYSLQLCWTTGFIAGSHCHR